VRILAAVLFIALLTVSCGKQETKSTKLFSRVDINFKNQLTDSDDFNIIEYLYYYNGGGVAAGDVNNDGLCDLYFSSNQESNKLFLNKGDIEFDDITQSSGTDGVKGWKTGVCMADVNGDGWLDIFIAGVGNYKKFDGHNQLLINNQDLTFTDRTEEYGLSFKGLSTEASFFDYDNDGDLDMYLVNHSVHSTRSLGQKLLRYDHDSIAGDRLYRNELVPSGKTHFKDVTIEAGIFNSPIGYGLSVATSDFNNDGFQDIYVSNDFHETDYLYINKKNGTFAQVIEKSVPHASRFSMGSAAADINEDGWSDIVTLDMRPRDEIVIKTTQQEDNYDIYRFKLGFGYHYQYARNAMQINNGVDDEGNVLFTDVAPYAGLDATDWSWSPVVADFNNDGLKDLFVSNGILQRPNSLDYINYISSDSAQQLATDKTIASKMPDGKVADMIFMNKSNMTFESMGDKWMDTKPDISNGAVSADLDNDGDMEIVINSLNDHAVIWKNNSNVDSSRFLKIHLEGRAPNNFGIGTKVRLFFGGKSVYLEQQPVRGWESSSEPVLHAGLGKAKVVDSLTVIWPDGKYQTLKVIQSNQELMLKQADAINNWDYSKKDKTVLSQVSSNSFVHKENDYNPFELEPLLLSSLASQGPCLATGDFNGDGLNDYFIGGATGQHGGGVYVQNKNGDFTRTDQPALGVEDAEDAGATAVDVNGDGALDLVVVGGGQQFMEHDKRTKPRVYLNNGKGKFRISERSIPEIKVNASCVTSADIDLDGDNDLFIGGIAVTKYYGMDPRSFVLINDGHGKFEDKTQEWLSDLIPGMVSDAVLTDLNNDKKPDLIMVGEWMPIKVFINIGGSFADNTEKYGLARTSGLWNTLAVEDMDGDGDLDIVAGNLGLNSRLTASVANPLEFYAGDIDSNFSLDLIFTYYNQGIKYPLVSRDLLVKQVPPLKRKFLKYEDYGRVTLNDILSPGKQAFHKVANTLASSYLENVGGKFEVKKLPKEAQYTSIYSILPADVDKDGAKDLLLVGNIDAVQPDIGRFDGSYGLILKGDGKGNFTSLPVSAGFVVKGQGRDIKSVINAKGERVYIVARNNDQVLYFK
jgi:hypothetical protein